jgi:hypothetical protein
MAVKKKKIAYQPAGLNQKQIDEMFDRFAHPLMQHCAPNDFECGCAISMFLWISLITETDSRNKMLNTLERSFASDPSTNSKIISIYLSKMKTRLTELESNCLKKHYSSPSRLDVLLKSYLSELERYCRNTSTIVKAVLTDTQIQEMYNRFSSPFVKAESISQTDTGSLLVSKALWLRLITGADSKNQICKDLDSIITNTNIAKNKIQRWYFSVVKKSLTKSEILTLQEHYSDKTNLEQLEPEYTKLGIRCSVFHTMK